jgi:hypothetical protein
VDRWSPALLAPLAGFFILLAQGDWDVHWENHKAHFWLVFGVAVVNAVLGFAMSEAARRRGDARVFLVGLVFLTTGGFLGLHALATPGVLLDGKNTGFVVATPVGLFLGSCLAAASGLDFSGERSLALIRRERSLRLALLFALAGWAAWSLTSLPPLDAPLPPSDATGPLVGFAIAGGGLYAFAAWRYFELYRRRPTLLLVAVLAAWILLTEALIAIAFAHNWHATWWEWHVLMCAAFLLVAVIVRREYRRSGSIAEAFGGLYLEDTIGSPSQRTRSPCSSARPCSSATSTCSTVPTSRRVWWKDCVRTPRQQSSAARSARSACCSPTCRDSRPSPSGRHQQT